MKSSYFRVVRTAVVAVAAVLAIGMLSQNASAQSCGYGGGYGGYGGGYGGYSSSYYSPRVSTYYGGGYGNYYGGNSFGLSYNSYYVPRHTWHDTSHWDVTPARLVPHGDHLDYIPARRYWHSTGHLHHNH